MDDSCGSVGSVKKGIAMFERLSLGGEGDHKSSASENSRTADPAGQVSGEGEGVDRVHRTEDRAETKGKSANKDSVSEKELSMNGSENAKEIQPDLTSGESEENEVLTAREVTPQNPESKASETGGASKKTSWMAVDESEPQSTNFKKNPEANNNIAYMVSQEDGTQQQKSNTSHIKSSDITPEVDEVDRPSSKVMFTSTPSGKFGRQMSLISSGPLPEGGYVGVARHRDGNHMGKTQLL